MKLALVISPAKKMNVVEGPPHAEGLPRFLERTEQLMTALQALSFDEAQALWKTSDRLTALNRDRLRAMDLTHGAATAAAVAYEGIAFQHLAAAVMDGPSLDYLRDHLRILSGFYGVLAPFDGVVPYRLEMQQKLSVGGYDDLYAFWGDSLLRSLAEEGFTDIVNVASVEYARALALHAGSGMPAITTCLFGDLRDGRLVQRATEAKAARGTFVRWCAERNIEELDGLRAFAERGYAYDERLSTDKALAFVRQSA